MSLIHPSEISSIQTLDLRVKAIVEGFMSGLHRSPYHGFSVEFSEYRSYNPGDPTRAIDWKVYGKTDRLVIKKYEADTNLSATVLFDISRSMNFDKAGVSKSDYAKNLAAAIMYLLSKQNDAIGLCLYSDEIKLFAEAKTGSRHFNHLLKLLDHAGCSDETSLKDVLELLKQKLSKRGLLIVFSDLFEDEEELIKTLGYYQNTGHDIIVFHILDAYEINFQFEEKTTFVDSETGEEIEVVPESVQEGYQKLTTHYLERMKQRMNGFQIDYYPVFTTDFYETHLLEFLNKRQKEY